MLGSSYLGGDIAPPISENASGHVRLPNSMLVTPEGVSNCGSLGRENEPCRQTAKRRLITIIIARIYLLSRRNKFPSRRIQWLEMLLRVEAFSHSSSCADKCSDR